MGRRRVILCGLLGVLLAMGCGMRRDLPSNTEGDEFSEGGTAPGRALDQPGEEGESDSPDEAEELAGCDGDLDGVISEACGGGDCDDSNPSIHPGATEQCNFTDDDCDGEINEDEYCGIYVHTRDQLLLIEPFVGEVVEEGAVPDLLDFDTAPDGTLYGITFSSLVAFDEEAREWEVVGTFGAMDGSANGFAIRTAGSGYATSGNTLYLIDLNEGAAMEIGEFGEPYRSSGDCVINKSGRLFFSSKHDEAQDHLMEVDNSTGAAWVIGPIGFADVWGLTFAWGALFGFTRRGEVIRINSDTGAGELLHVFPERAFWGAASSPER